MPVWPPQFVKIRAGKRGSGWAVGEVGVLTARHVVANYISNPFNAVTNVDGIHCRVVTGGEPDSQTHECSIVWEDESRDLALIRVTEYVEAWRERLTDEGATVLAAPGSEPIHDVTLIGFPNSTVDDQRRTNPEQAMGILLPAGGPMGLMNLDIETKTPSESALWQGMSGAAVREPARARLLGIVAQHPDPRQGGPSALRCHPPGPRHRSGMGE